MNGTLTGFLVSRLFSFKGSFMGVDFALEIWLFTKLFLYPRFVINVLVQLIWYRRSHLLNKYAVNGEQGCRGFIFSCETDDLKSVVSIGVYRWVCSIGHCFYFTIFEKGIYVYEGNRSG